MLVLFQYPCFLFIQNCLVFDRLQLTATDLQKQKRIFIKFVNLKRTILFGWFFG